jgi:2-polyprenyl-3-methyl-5-hydroxy-6-metoxy-1,4-benzoquinol methylase
MEDENSQGTDLQICRRAKEDGWKVACDTSIVIGHEYSDRFVVHSENRHLLIEDAHRTLGKGITQELDNWQEMVMADVMEYTELRKEEILTLGDGARYELLHRNRFSQYTESKEYYRSIGEDQIFRHVVYHRTPDLVATDASIINMFRGKKKLEGLDFGCGISEIGFEILKLGHSVDFVDIEGTAVFDFVKWRIKKYKLDTKANFSVGGPYDFVLLMDIIEHLKDWECYLDDIVGRMNVGAALFTNLFMMELRENDPEHVHMDKTGVQKFLTDRGFIPTHLGLWIKMDNFLGGAKNVKNIRENVDTGDGPTVGQAG